MNRRRFLYVASSNVEGIKLNLKCGDNGEQGIQLYELFLTNATQNYNSEYEWFLTNEYEITYTFSCGTTCTVDYLYTYPNNLSSFADLATCWTACGAPVQFVRLYKDGTIEEYLDD